MNKFIIFALLLVFVLNEDVDDYYYIGTNAILCAAVENPSVENCNKITIDDDDYKCCYLYEKDEDGEEEKNCLAIKKNKAKKIIDFEEDDGNTDVSLDCSSNYISNALIILLSLLF